MARTVVPEAEALIDLDIQVLDKGFVRLVDYMGGDQRIVQAARVSYGEGTKTYRQDRGLIHYLLRHGHTSPFEQVQLTFHVKMPIFVARQWIRHRTARLNEISGRYSVMKDEIYVPTPDAVCTQSVSNKQGRGETLPLEQALDIIAEMEREQRLVYDNYVSYIEKGVARELARANLPLGLYTEMYWQVDLHNLFHFLKLRIDPHAQFEIREFGLAVAKCTKAVAPLAYEAFEEHVVGSLAFSRTEVKALEAILTGEPLTFEDREIKDLPSKLIPLGGDSRAPSGVKLSPKEEISLWADHIKRRLKSADRQNKKQGIPQIMIQPDLFESAGSIPELILDLDAAEV
jgi:thymidylate synthase (FAD)